MFVCYQSVVRGVVSMLIWLAISMLRGAIDRECWQYVKRGYREGVLSVPGCGVTASWARARIERKPPSREVL